MSKGKIALFIPTYNAGEEFKTVLNLIDEQIGDIDKKYIIDSSSTDETVRIAKEHNFDVEVISSQEFGHGKTRTYAAKKLSNYEYIIFLTQDIYLQTDALKNLIDFIKHSNDIAVAYGKQEVDMRKGNIFEERSRNFNYPEHSIIKSKKNIKEYGIKTVFSSDAFAIYNLSKLKSIGYFPETLNFSEDMYAAAQFIDAGFSVGYCAEAKVYHTHNYSIKEEYYRYKSIGQFHKSYPYIQEQFGSNNSEGIKLVFSEVKYLLRNNLFFMIPESILRNIAKYLGYKAVN